MQVESMGSIQPLPERPEPPQMPEQNPTQHESPPPFFHSDPKELFKEPGFLKKDTSLVPEEPGSYEKKDDTVFGNRGVMNKYALRKSVKEHIIGEDARTRAKMGLKEKSQAEKFSKDMISKMHGSPDVISTGKVKKEIAEEGQQIDRDRRAGNVEAVKTEEKSRRFWKWVLGK